LEPLLVGFAEGEGGGEELLQRIGPIAGDGGIGDRAKGGEVTGANRGGAGGGGLLAGEPVGDRVFEEGLVEEVEFAGGEMVEDAFAEEVVVGVDDDFGKGDA
jgi:hypothetical protein